MIQSCRSSAMLAAEFCSTMDVAIETVHPVGMVAMAMLWLLTANRTTAGPELCVCVCMALLHYQGKVFFFLFFFLQASRQIRPFLCLFNL